MQTFFREFIRLLQRRHENILETIEGLSPEALDWSPGNETNSISVLVTHLTGAERYWIGDVAAQESSHRDRDAEFRVHDVAFDALQKRLDSTVEYARKTLDSFTYQDLESMRTTGDGENVTVAWALLHALEHTTLHLGQIQLTRQLWEQASSR